MKNTDKLRIRIEYSVSRFYQAGVHAKVKATPTSDVPN
jgi:hypothetical protein